MLWNFRSYLRYPTNKQYTLNDDDDDDDGGDGGGDADNSIMVTTTMTTNLTTTMTVSCLGFAIVVNVLEHIYIGYEGNIKYKCYRDFKLIIVLH